MKMPGGWLVDVHVNVWAGSTEAVARMLKKDEVRIYYSIMSSGEPTDNT